MVDSEEAADVGIFNSCSVTADAEADLRQGLRRAARRNSSIKSIVTGCAAGRVLESGDAHEMLSLPGVSAVVGPADLEGLSRELGIPTGTISPRAAVQGSARALLRIQDGCDEHCTFCITTIARGNNRSRREEDILQEARELAESHPEIVLTGTHIGSYGSDTGSSLGTLVERLLREIPAARFRLSSIEATEVDDLLLELLRDRNGQLVPYLHAPLQSGSDRLLKRMGRNWYSAGEYRDRIERVVRDLPVFGLGADIITGFPGELDADHSATVSLVDSLPFTKLHVFPFSERAGTAAVNLPHAVEPGVSRERAAELRSISDRKLSDYMEVRIAHPADVVVVRRGKGITEDLLDVVVPYEAARGARFRAILSRRDLQLTASLSLDT